MTVSYSVTFLREHKDRWFNHENYIQVMCDHLRSLVRGRCRNHTLRDLWPTLSDQVRSIILGDRPADGTARKGRTFGENGALVAEVEVLATSIEDEEIADLMLKVQTQSVTLQIGDRQAQETLASAKLRAEVEKQNGELASANAQRVALLVDPVSYTHLTLPTILRV